MTDQTFACHTCKGVGYTKVEQAGDNVWVKACTCQDGRAWAKTKKKIAIKEP